MVICFEFAYKDIRCALLGNVGCVVLEFFGVYDERSELIMHFIRKAFELYLRCMVLLLHKEQFMLFRC